MIDVGTGSDALAIAAAKLGAVRVIAVDNDPDALQNAHDNIIRNGARDAIEILNIDLSTASLEPAEIVLANLTGAVLQRHAATLQRLVAPDGILILSGFSPGETDDVAGAFQATPQETLSEGEWTAMRIRASSAPHR